MKNTWKVLGSLLVGYSFLPGLLHAQCHISLQVDNIMSGEGKIMLAIFSHAEGFPQDPKKAVKLQSVAAVKGHQKIDIGGLPKGKYAIAVYHDANSDSQLNTNRFGIPVEGYAFSNNVRGYFGPPDFEEAVIQVAGKTDVRISLVY